MQPAATGSAGAEEPEEPHGGERLGEHDEQLEGDPGAGERLVLDEVGEGRGGVAVDEEPGPDDQEAEAGRRWRGPGRTARSTRAVRISGCMGLLGSVGTNLTT